MEEAIKDMSLSVESKSISCLTFRRVVITVSFPVLKINSKLETCWDSWLKSTPGQLLCSLIWSKHRMTCISIRHVFLSSSNNLVLIDLHWRTKFWITRMESMQVTLLILSVSSIDVRGNILEHVTFEYLKHEKWCVIRREFDFDCTWGCFHC